MAITGLTDRSPSFKELGRLRLGIPKSEIVGNQGPQEIGWFRADFRPDAKDAEALFIAEYKDKPTSINFRLPFDEIKRCWDPFYEIYNKFGMLGKADGKRWLYLRHNRTGELLVKDGVPTHTDGTKVDPETGEIYLPFDPKVPVYSYTSKKGNEVKVYAKPTGRLRILIPELKRAAYVQIITNSLYNCIKISEQLAGVAEIAKSAGMSLPQVPMTITRRLESISVSFDGHKQMQDHYLLNIEIDPRWMEAQFAYLNALMPGGTPPIPLQLTAAGPKIDVTPEDLSEDEGPFIDEDDQNAAQTEQVEAGLVNGTPRPYGPEKLCEKLLARADYYEGRIATQKQRNLVAQLIGEIFAGPESDLMRHALQDYLFGTGSIKDVDDEFILVCLNDWLKPEKDTGGAYKPDPVAVKEAIAAYEEAVKVKGQMPLPIEGEASKVAENIPF